VFVKLSSGASVLLIAEEARKAHPRIALRYRLPGDRSEDLPVPSATVSKTKKLRKKPVKVAASAAARRKSAAARR